MNNLNFGDGQFNSGALNDMLRQVGINDINSFVNQFRNQVSQESMKNSNNNQTKNQQPDFLSMGSSLFNQLGGNNAKKQGTGAGNSSTDLIGGAINAYSMFSGSKSSSSGNSSDMVNSAMNVYKMFSGGKSGGTTGGGNFLDNIGATMDSAQQMHSMLKKLDRNGDGKVTVDDIQLIFESLGLGSVSPQLSKALFKAVDQNHNGQLDLTDVMALAAIVSKLTNHFGPGVNASKQTGTIPQS